MSIFDFPHVIVELFLNGDKVHGRIESANLRERNSLLTMAVNRQRHSVEWDEDGDVEL
jgi:hypothetical protein